jgi:site-specific DNA-adenine methylase
MTEPCPANFYHAQCEHPVNHRGPHQADGGAGMTTLWTEPASDQPLQAPFPYFGGKSRAAQTIWQALGDVGGYIEPFCGSAAVLLARPPFTGRRVETINDADGWLINTWRAIQLSPTETAHHAYGPVAEIDYHARLAWLQERRGPDLVAWLEGDPENHDPKAAGWWLYVIACAIGDPWNKGPWRVVDGHLRDTRKLPHLGNPGQGITRGLPHLGDPGQGINRELPHLGNPGQQTLTNYMQTLANRLHKVRITCGTWQRITQPSAIRATLTNPHIGVLLDPPYTTSGDLYATTNTTTNHATIANNVRDWATQNEHRYRIILCGYNNDHDELLTHGWRKDLGPRNGGYSGDSRRERLWFSPLCIEHQSTLFDFEDADR